MTDITICHNEEKMLLTINDEGKLPLESLRQRFPKADGLAYKDEDGQIRALTISFEEIIINPKIKEYDVHIIETPQTPKATESKLPAEDGTSKEIEQQPSAVKSVKSARKSILRTPIKRLKTLRVGWLHKGPTDKNYCKMKRPLGGVKRLKLDESQSYPAHEIRRMAMEEFTGDSSKLEDRFDVRLGFFDGRAISEFKRPDDDRACDIWDYCQAHNTHPYRLNLFILTSSKDDEPPAIGNVCNLQPKPDDVRLFYHYARVSKYTQEISYTECERFALHSYVMEETCGEAPPIELFEPLDYGHALCRIERDGQVLLQIRADEDSGKSFSFPSADGTAEAHVIVHQLQGWSDGKLGIGVVPNCGLDCRPILTWYRDGEVYRRGEFLYWLSDVLEDGMKHAWSCTVMCRQSGRELKSKIFEIDDE